MATKREAGEIERKVKDGIAILRRSESIEPDWRAVIFFATGIPVTLCWTHPAPHTYQIFDDLQERYRVPVDQLYPPRTGDEHLDDLYAFMDWYADGFSIYYPSPAEAACTFLLAWRYWNERGKPRIS
jgi:hypothetical protein